MAVALNIRRANYRFHAWAGFICAWFLIVVGLTGSVLVFEEEISTAIHPDWHQVAATGTSIGLDEIDSKLRKDVPEHDIAGLRLPGCASESLQASLLRDGMFSIAYVNLHNGEILGLSTPHWRHIALKIHNALALGDRGAACLFLIACGMVLQGASGLWMQRNLWRWLFRFPRFEQSTRLGMADLHRTISIPCCLFLLVLGSTGAFYNWAAIGRIASGNADPPGLGTSKRSHESSPISIDTAVETAKRNIPELSPSYISFPRNGDGILRVFGSVPGQSLFGRFASSVDIASSTGGPQLVRDIRSMPWSGKWKCLIRPLHHGNFGGTLVKIIYSSAGIGIAALSITGLRIRKHRMEKFRSHARLGMNPKDGFSPKSG